MGTATNQKKDNDIINNDCDDADKKKEKQYTTNLQMIHFLTGNHVVNNVSLKCFLIIFISSASSVKIDISHMINE